MIIILHNIKSKFGTKSAKLMTMELVSILIPVYNREHYIAQCIQSALNQTYKKIEIIIVDNASTDETWNICQKFARHDPRVRIFQNPENIGPVLNWKRCIDKAKGILGKILFSDDLMRSDYLEKTVPMLRNEEVGFVFTEIARGASVNAIRIKYKWSNKITIFNSEKFIENSLLVSLNQTNVPFSPAAGLFRLRSLKENLIWNIPSPNIKDFKLLGAGPDLLLYLLTATQFSKVGFIPEPLVYFRSHDETLTKTNFNIVTIAYLQTMIWLANKLQKKSWFQKLIAFQWLFELSIERRWISPNRYLRRYKNYYGKLTWSWSSLLWSFSKALLMRLQYRNVDF